MKFTVEKVTTLNELSKELEKKGIENTIKNETLLNVHFQDESYKIIKSDDHFEIYKPASGVVCNILAAIPAAICYVICKSVFELSGFLLSMTAFVPFIIFQMLLQSAMKSKTGGNIGKFVLMMKDRSSGEILIKKDNKKE